jgi:cobalt-zinc-cadmium efflux system protein
MIRSDLMDSHRLRGQNFLIVTVLNLLITIVEIIGGIISGSLALLSDAFHNLGDSFSIVLGYVAQLIAHRPESKHRTYGYRRAEILSAFLNALFLIVISIFLIVEAAKRFAHPQPVNGEIMLMVAVVGLVANFASAYLLHRGSKDSLNVKATYLHVLSDALSSLAVIIGGFILMFVDLPWLDPVLTIGVSLYVASEAWPIIRQTVGILMQSSPDLDFKSIDHDLMQIEGVNDVHHIHAWQIDEHRIIFSAHISCDNLQLCELGKIYDQINDVLQKKYGIAHVTIQAECDRGDDKELFNTKEDQQNICN